MASIHRALISHGVLDVLMAVVDGLSSGGCEATTAAAHHRRGAQTAQAAQAAQASDARQAKRRTRRRRTRAAAQVWLSIQCDGGRR